MQEVEGDNKEEEQEEGLEQEDMKNSNLKGFACLSGTSPQASIHITSRQRVALCVSWIAVPASPVSSCIIQKVRSDI